jgi:hypothetical protein
MNPEIEQLLERLKTAQTSTEIARVTVKLLRACGVFNVQSVGYELARISVTNSPE